MIKNKNLTWSDFYTQNAKKNGYPSRAVYKLKEIQKKYNILKKGHCILDLGCAPGSWLLYSSKKVGLKGLVIGVDLIKTNIFLPSNIEVLNCSIFNNPFRKKNIKFNSILSDMAPKISGNRAIDDAQSLQLSQESINIAKKQLIKGGNFVCKIFHNKETKNLSKIIEKIFKRQLLFKPKSSRKTSREIYLIGLYKF